MNGSDKTMKTAVNQQERCIYSNCIVYTMDEKGSVKQAISTVGDTIEAVGSNDEIMSLADSQTRIFDLGGRAVIPGICDTHVHLFRAGLSELGKTLFIPRSVSELLSYVQNRVSDLAPGEWIHLRNTYPLRLKEQRFPTIDELDRVAPVNPVIVDGAYAAQLNTAAMELVSGKTGDLKMLEPGLFLGTVWALTEQVRLVNEKQDYMAATKNMQNRYNRYGITCVIDGMSDVEGIETVNRLYEANELGLRLRYTVCVKSAKTAINQIQKMRQAIKTPPEWGQLPFLKILLDGGILTCTSFMKKPYDGSKTFFGPGLKDFRGIVYYCENDILEFIRVAIEEKLQMTAHSIGDGACEILLSAYEKADKVYGVNGKRYSIIHGDFTSDAMLERIRKLGLVLLFQPAWDYMDGQALSGLLDKETMDTFLPYRSFLESGIHACAGSDHMVGYDSFNSCNPYNPFVAIYNMVTGKTREGSIRPGRQTVSRHEAVEFYTKKAAYLTFEEDSRGTLEPGKMADFAVLSDDCFECPEEDIKEIEAVMTVVGGRRVYDLINAQ
jgi:predicted amidohydrolase YtcJ